MWCNIFSLNVSLCSKCGKQFTTRFNRRKHEQFNCPTVREEEPLIAYSFGASPRHSPGYKSPSPQPGPSTSHVDRPFSPQPGPSRAAQPSPPADTPSEHSPNNASTQHNQGMFRRSQTGFKSRLQTFQLKRHPARALSIPHFFIFVFEALVFILTNALREFHSIKVNLFLECEFINMKGSTCVRAFKTKNTPLTIVSDLGQFCSDAFDRIIHEKDQCQMVGSGWTFLRVLNLEIRINKYNPLRGATFISLPKAISRRGGVLNVNNRDRFCFMYALLAKFVIHSPERPTSYTDNIKRRYNLDGLEFPVALRDIAAFEVKNNISINVYGLDRTLAGVDLKGTPIFKNAVFPLKVCDYELADHTETCSLLLLCFSYTVFCILFKHTK